MEQKKIRVIIAEDIDTIRDHFVRVLSFEKDIEVVDAVNNGQKAYDSVVSLKPDILLTDIQMDDYSDGLETLEKLTHLDVDVACIILTVHKEDELIYKAFEVGAIDYITKDASAVIIINSIRMAYEGEVSLRPGIANKLRKEFMRIKSNRDSFLNFVAIFCRLTQSEIEILDLLSKNLNTTQICEKRHIEHSTIRSHVNNILKKFDMHSTKEVVGFVQKFGMDELMKKYFEYNR